MNYKVTINGIDVDAYYSEESINHIFLPLLRKLSEMQKEKSSRILVMLAAPPGSGKSTLVEFLKQLSETTDDVTPVNVIGMDGFHRYQDYLDTHYMMREGKEVVMAKFKGAPETFDLEKLTAQLKKVASGEECGWPFYNRMIHNPMENAIEVKGDIILIEGNYLLLDWEGWKDLKGMADYTIKITASDELLRNRLIERKMNGGIDRVDAERFVNASDLYNVRTCLSDSQDADLNLVLNMDDSYSLR